MVVSPPDLELSTLSKVLTQITIIFGSVFCFIPSIFLLGYLLIVLQFSNLPYTPYSIGNDPLYCCAFFNNTYVKPCNQTMVLKYLLDNNLTTLDTLIPQCTPNSNYPQKGSQLTVSSSLITFIIAISCVLLFELVVLIIMFSIQSLSMKSSSRLSSKKNKKWTYGEEGKDKEEEEYGEEEMGEEVQSQIQQPERIFPSKISGRISTMVDNVLNGTIHTVHGIQNVLHSISGSYHIKKKQN
jgi:hypothetical protein